MHADPTQQGDFFITDSGIFQFLQKRRDKEMVGAGAGNIGENNADPVTGLCHLCQHGAAERVFQCLVDGSRHILDGCHGL